MAREILSLKNLVAQPPVSNNGFVASYVRSDGYASNFSAQWRHFTQTQLDSKNKTNISRDHLTRLLGGPIESLKGKSVLEIGAGAGRFTEHLITAAAAVVAVDLSEAIFVNAGLGAPNFVALQADLFQMPTFKQQFDVVFCRGVLQHTPDPPAAIRLLHEWVTPDGMVIFDVYRKPRLGSLSAKYLWRRLVPRFFSPETFMIFLDKHAERLLRWRWSIKALAPRKLRPIVNGLLYYPLPVHDYRDFLPLTDEQLVEWGKLDTLDAMFPKYDCPMTFGEIKTVLREASCEIISADPTGNIFRTRRAASHQATDLRAKGGTA